MLETMLDIFFVILKIYAVYFALISIFGIFRLKTPPKTEKQLKFAVLVAARNEESCIGGIVESIKKQNYPSHLCDIYVIPNNCTDNTALVATMAGAKVLSVSSAVKSKGAAIREATNRLMNSPENYDVFCVFDADNEADENFIAEMSRTLCNGANVAKSRILSKNRHESWVCACYDIYFCNANLFMNRARQRLGLSARLIGTGFAVKCDFLREIGGFSTETITEDAEFYAICAAKGEKIAFCERAVTYDEEPLSFKTSLVQRKRWMSGILQVTALKLPDILRGLFRRGSFFTCLDVFLQLTFAYVQALLPFAFLLLIFADSSAFFTGLPLSILSGYLSTAGLAVVVLLLQKRLNCKMILGIATYPIFIISFIPLQTISLFKRTTNWREIKHTGVRMESITQNVA